MARDYQSQRHTQQLYERAFSEKKPPRRLLFTSIIATKKRRKRKKKDGKLKKESFKKGRIHVAYLLQSLINKGNKEDKCFFFPPLLFGLFAKVLFLLNPS